MSIYLYLYLSFYMTNYNIYIYISIIIYSIYGYLSLIIYLYANLLAVSTYLPNNLPVCLSVYLSIYLSVPVCLSVYLFYLILYLSYLIRSVLSYLLIFYPSICLSIDVQYLSLYLSIYISRVLRAPRVLTVLPCFSQAAPKIRPAKHGLLRLLRLLPQLTFFLYHFFLLVSHLLIDYVSPTAHLHLSKTRWFSSKLPLRSFDNPTNFESSI